MFSRLEVCKLWGLAALLGFAGVAYGQDPAHAIEAAQADPGLAMMLEALRLGGLPGVLVLIAWKIGSSGGVPVTVSLSDADREILRQPSGPLTVNLSEADRNMLRPSSTRRNVH